MSKFVKQLLAKELEGKFVGINNFIVVDMTGTSGLENNALRGKLCQKGIKVTMVKNAMMRQAAETLGLTASQELFKTGSCSVVYGEGDVVGLAKDFKECLEKKTKITFKGAYVEGEILDAKASENLVKMKGRKELQGEIVMLANSPARKLAGAVAGPAAIIAGCIKAIADKDAA